MKSLKDKVAAITGAGSGIGRATAKLLAKHGANLALSDVNEQGLAETVEQCRAAGVNVTSARVDVADREAVERWAQDVVRDHRTVNIVINNAGVAVAGTVEDLRYEDFEWIMGINFWGVVHGTKAFLPHVKASGDGHIVNISSVFGLIAMPTQGAYNASKFAVKGFTEALAQELEIEGSHVGVTCVHPGGIKTNIAKNARLVHRPGWVDERSQKGFEKMFRTTPEQAASDIVRAIQGRRRRLLIGSDAVMIDLMSRALPQMYQRLLARQAKRGRMGRSSQNPRT